MRKVSLTDYEGPSGLRLGEAPAPRPARGELLVRVEAAGVTLPLLKVLRGHGEVPLPYSPGGDLVGRVIAVGDGVTEFRTGDRVGGVVFADLYADLVLARPAFLTRVPEDADAARALAVVRSGLVALAALRTGALAAGDSVLVTAAAGGLGHLAVQLARANGAKRVVAAVGTQEKAAFLHGLGADEVVPYTELAGVEPVDLVVESVGGDVLRAAAGALAPFGRIVVNSGAGGTLDAGALLRGMHTATGLAMAQLARHRPALLETCRTELWDHLATDRLRPACVEYPLERIAEAVELMERRQNTGKIVIRPL